MSASESRESPAPDVEIRAARPEDAEALTALVHASSAYGDRYAPMLEGYRLTERQIARDHVFVAERDGDLVGFYALVAADGAAELDLLFVADDAQRGGVGAALVAHMRALAASLGVSRVLIVSHPPAAAFYRRIGAEDAGTLPPSGRIDWERPILSLRIGDGSAPAQGRVVRETGRLRLRELHASDAEFIFRLVNDADWLRHIGDKNVRTLADAHGYIANGPVAMYARHGFGLWRVELRDTREPIGISGLIKRDTLDDVDIGFAFLPAFRGRGYAREAAEASLAHARDEIGLARVVAIVSPANADSAKLLERIGLRFEGMLALGGRDDVRLFSIDF